MAKVKTRFLIKLFFGTLPKTSQIEEDEKELKNELKTFTDFENSEELKDILEMEKEVNSKQFKQKLQALKDDTFDKTDEFKRLQEYNQLKKSKLIKFYFKYRDKGKPERLLQIAKSGKLEELEKLEKEVSANAFIEKKEELKAEKTFDNSAEQLKEQEYLGLKKDRDIKEYHKINNSGKYKRFVEAEKSQELETYYKLEELVTSKEFLAFKAEKEDTERYKQSEEYKFLQKYEATLAQDHVKKYFSLKGSDKFDDLKAYETTFFDGFDGKELDADKWINNYFWGKALMNESYSLVNDKHFITNGNNIEIKNSICKITTRKEKAEGKSWDPRIGFYPRNFEYTSGLISTGESFRQKTGRFEAKVKLNSIHPVTHAFWMVSEKMLPQIDIFKTGHNNKISFSNHWGKEIKSSLSRFTGKKIVSDFCIYSLEWTPEKLIWKINNIVVKEETKGLPEDKMYILFSSGLQIDPNDSNLPVSMEIDWVRCSQKVKS
ncbi:MAG: glycoside hydrolase family 16 protein [Bacteroidota bacterium]|nr:glycoside hydrolase family 16 protein [Bacteroidota bacterium]